MERIFKYPVPMEAEPVIKMPRGARVLTVQAQYGLAHLWVVGDDEAELEDHKFHLRGTGQVLGEVGAYIGTVQVGMGNQVYHLFTRYAMRGETGGTVRSDYSNISWA